MSNHPSNSFNDTASKTPEVLPQWDLSSIYPAYDSPEFKADFEKVKKLVANFVAKYDGKIVALDDQGTPKKDANGNTIMLCDGETLAQSLKDDEEIDHLLGRMFTYLSLKTVQRKDLYQADEIKFGNEITPILTPMTFFSHAILDLPEKPLQNAIKKTPSLQRYKPVL